MRRALVAVAVLAGVTALGTSPASGGHISCGDVVTADIQLTHDLTCAGNALVAGASNIVIDLGGYTLTGNDTLAGVSVRAPHEGVTVRNGIIRSFREGVVLDRSNHNHVWKLTFIDNDRGILVSRASGNLIEKNQARTSNRDGIVIDGFDADGNLVQKNALTDNGFGISASNGAHDNVIAKNDLTGGLYGISVFSDSDGNLVEKNYVSGMRFEGIQIESQSDNTLVSKNTSTDNGTDGILVEPAGGPFAGDPTGTVVVKNTANGNGDDGIDVDSAATTLVKNTANGNDDLGIEAVGGVVDGGGNRATGNGDPAECVGVVCG